MGSLPAASEEPQGGRCGWSGGNKGEYSEGVGELAMGVGRADRLLGPCRPWPSGGLGFELWEGTKEFFEQQCREPCT